MKDQLMIYTCIMKLQIEGLVEKGAMCIFYTFEKIEFKVKSAFKNSVLKQTG